MRKLLVITLSFVGVFLLSQTGLGQELRLEELTLISRLQDLTLSGYTGGFILDPNNRDDSFLLPHLYSDLEKKLQNDPAFRDDFRYYLEYVEGNLIKNKDALNNEQRNLLTYIREVLGKEPARGSASLGEKIFLNIFFPLGIIHRPQDQLVGFLDQSMKGIEIPDMSGRVFTAQKLKSIIDKIIYGIECSVDIDLGKSFRSEDFELLKAAFRQFRLDREQYKADPEKYNKEYLNMLWRNFNTSSKIIPIFNEYYNNNKNTGALDSISEKIEFFENYIIAQQNLVKHNTEYVLFYKKLFSPKTEEYSKVMNDLQINKANLERANQYLKELKRAPKR